eukprot:TRINITY_DN67139_c1_g1_i2.p1 TRINITY_DN67139_c1_g1~~TRINITY_DN67139_c1_g1_i2.p1  ORF type:complete len:246 (-),score=27.01 TRINITY_DN67139_c1_g1_i2:77-814(-)
MRRFAPNTHLVMVHKQGFPVPNDMGHSAAGVLHIGMVLRHVKQLGMKLTQGEELAQETGLQVPWEEWKFQDLTNPHSTLTGVQFAVTHYDRLITTTAGSYVTAGLPPELTFPNWCPTPPVVSNAVSQRMTAGKVPTVEYHCADGSRILLTCGQQSWHPTTATCASCGKPTARFLQSFWQTSPNTLVYQCAAGFYPSPQTVHCVNGTWGPAPVCHMSSHVMVVLWCLALGVLLLVAIMHGQHPPGH